MTVVTPRQKFRFLLVGVDLQVHLHTFFFSRGFQHIADRGCRETVAADEHRDIRFGQHQLEPQLSGREFGHFQLRLGRIINQLHRDILQKIPKAVGNRFHEANMERNRPLRKSGLTKPRDPGNARGWSRDESLQARHPAFTGTCMTSWFYTRGNRQNGPVSFEQLANLAHTGDLEPHDLVWNTSMENWIPASEVPGLFPAPVPTPPPVADATKPVENSPLVEIPPGSDPIDVLACLKRGIELTLRHFQMIIMLGLTCLGITIAAYSILDGIDAKMGWEKITPRFPDGFESVPKDMRQDLGSPFNFIVTQIISIFIYLGSTRIYLNLASGKPASLLMLFKEGPKLIRTISAVILFASMVTLGLVLFILPGIYIALRFGFFMVAIVDRNMGVLESLAYSSSITTRNRWHLFGLFGLSLCVVFAIMLFGAIAALIGVAVVMPAIALAHVTAYRWLQYGNRAALDGAGKHQPTAGGL